MEQVIMCKKLTAIYKEDGVLLSGPHICNLTIEKECKFWVEIEQFGIRKITITSEQDVPVEELTTIFSRIERLIMLFDGVFISLSEINFSDSDTIEDKKLRTCSEHYKNHRLSYHVSAKFCNIGIDKLMNFEDVLTSNLFVKWEVLLEELDIIHQMYLYSLSDSRITVDVKCAFLIELAEPLVEVAKIYTNNFVDLHPGNRGTSLRDCLGALIEMYGQDIFNKEMSSNNNDDFLSVMVNSRVRIMHIKRKQTKKYFNGSESNLYSLKLSLLYRRIMFELLGISDENYKTALQNCVSNLNEWNGTLEKFLFKIEEEDN